MARLRIFLAAALTMSLGVDAYALVVMSCDGHYSAKGDMHGNLRISGPLEKVKALRVDHAVDGGGFTLKNSYLFVFGMPWRIDHGSPQVTRFSLYFLKPKPVLVMRQTYGGGIFSSDFSKDQKYLVLTGRYGVDVIDLAQKTIRSFDAGYIVPMELQQCDRG